MIENKQTIIRHSFEAEMLARALKGDWESASDVLKYLSSTYPGLRRIMMETIYDLAESPIWQNLLRCLALHRWDDHEDCEWRQDKVASERIDQSITEVFTVDESERDKGIKEAVLLESLNSQELLIRLAAGYLLGLRGDLQAVPVLAETIETGPREWKLRAIKVLAALKDEICGPPLMKALTMFRDEVHREAGRALNNLGQIVEPVWLEAINHTDSHIRWHAARGLGIIGDARHMDILAEGLFDENQAVRWATADVLANLGAPSVPATLKILSRRKLTEQTQQAAYHALHGIVSRKIQEQIKPLLDALGGSAASTEAPAIAQRLLLDWEKSN